MRLQFSAALLFCAAAGAAGIPVPTIEESLSMKSVAGAQISPDGRFVAYTVQQANWDENDFYTQIWIAMPYTGERYQLTSGKKSSSTYEQSFLFILSKSSCTRKQKSFWKPSRDREGSRCG